MRVFRLITFVLLVSCGGFSFAEEAVGDREFKVFFSGEKLKADKDGILYIEEAEIWPETNAMTVFTSIGGTDKAFTTKNKEIKMFVSGYHVLGDAHTRFFVQHANMERSGQLVSVAEIPVVSPRMKVSILVQGLSPGKDYTVVLTCLK